MIKVNYYKCNLFYLYMVNFNDFFNKSFSYAIIGASNNESKYGYKIFKTLKDTNFKVFPINSKEKEIYGVKAYWSILKIDEKIDVVDFVVPPKVTLLILKEVKSLGISKVWFQPGSFNDDCISFCKKNKISFISDFCLYSEALKNLK